MEGITTQRLHFRTLSQEDTSHWVSFLQDPINKRFHTVYNPTLEGAQKWVKNIQDRQHRDGFTLYALEDKYTHEFIGQCGPILQKVDGEELVEVGYHILATHRGKGYAPEAAQRAFEWIFDTLDVSFAVSIIEIDNLASIRVAEKNGLSLWKHTNWRGRNVAVYRLAKKQN